ncbi:MAG: hypothetical protein SVW02_04320 [Candidatus Nanohaloarchaea archaeon]|nr:hypothetical protein [Candidatus Nanohaloarchaea archaeon]
MALHEFLMAQVQGNNILLFLILIVLFVLAYKVLRAVINTAIVAALSGGFLVALDYVGIGPTVTVNRFMMFMVLGTGLFILYSAIATVIRTTSGLVGALRKIFGWMVGPLKREEEKVEKEKEIVLQELKDED